MNREKRRGCKPPEGIEVPADTIDTRDATETTVPITAGIRNQYP